MTQTLSLSEEDDFLIFGRDLQRAGTGCKDSVPWFEERGTTLRKVLKNGISAKWLLETGDVHAIRVVRLALEVRNGEEE